MGIIAAMWTLALNGCDIKGFVAEISGLDHDKPTDDCNRIACPRNGRSCGLWWDQSARLERGAARTWREGNG
jgi:hypothetical protein